MAHRVAIPLFALDSHERIINKPMRRTINIADEYRYR
jgi:hypothetical protein